MSIYGLIMQRLAEGWQIPSGLKEIPTKESLMSAFYNSLIPPAADGLEDGEDLVPDATIYGHEDVVCEKDVASCSWSISSPRGEKLMRVPFALAFDVSEIENSSQASTLLAATYACLASAPLTSEEVELLFVRFPSLRETPRLDTSESPWEPTNLPTEPTAAQLQEKKPAYVEAGFPHGSLTATRKFYD